MNFWKTNSFSRSLSSAVFVLPVSCVSDSSPALDTVLKLGVFLILSFWCMQDFNMLQTYDNTRHRRKMWGPEVQEHKMSVVMGAAVMAERAQDLPVVSQQGSSPGKDHQVGGPSGQSDSGYYPDSLDQTSPACRQTWKEQTENGATGGAELCDSEGAKEKQSSAELSGSGEQDVPTEQPRKDEDNTRSFPVIGPRVLVNEHVTSSAVPVKPPTTHDGEVAGEADTKKPQQESQPRCLVQVQVVLSLIQICLVLKQI
ncbi:hypothetical protein Bbelb_109770 [Branchiostoma belcheri]|nr:hypothetical protein Bbelb_109770 [Branchiostoma belcheri]